MERIRVAYMMSISRTGEGTARVRLWKHWWIAPWPYRKTVTGHRDWALFEIDTTGMGEYDVVRAALADALIYIEGGPDA